jgi:hypothetical protein
MTTFFGELDDSVNCLMGDIEEVLRETPDKELKFIIDDIDDITLKILELTADADGDDCMFHQTHLI